MKLKYQFVVNKIADNFVAVPVGDNVIDFNGALQLNDGAAFIIEQLNQEISYDDIINNLVERFGCDIETAKNNLDPIINELKDNDLLVE